MSRPATARPWCWRTCASRSRAGETLSIIGRNGVGKTTLLATVMGHTTLHGGDVRLHGQRHLAAAPYRRAGRARLRAAGARDLSLADAARKPRSGGARRGRGRSRRCSSCFPRLARARRQPRQSALRRRAADAGDRPRADRQSDRGADGRALGGPRAGHRRGARPRGEAARRDRRTRSRWCWSSRTRGSRSTSRRAPS